LLEKGKREVNFFSFEILAEWIFNPRRLPVSCMNDKRNVNGAKHRRRRLAIDISFALVLYKTGGGEGNNP